MVYNNRTVVGFNVRTLTANKSWSCDYMVCSRSQHASWYIITYVQEPTGREVVGVEVEERFRGQLLLKTHASRERTGQRIIFSIPHPPLVSASVDFTVCDNQLPSKRRHLQTPVSQFIVYLFVSSGNCFHHSTGRWTVWRTNEQNESLKTLLLVAFKTILQKRMTLLRNFSFMEQ